MIFVQLVLCRIASVHHDFHKIEPTKVNSPDSSLDKAAQSSVQHHITVANHQAVIKPHFFSVVEQDVLNRHELIKIIIH